MRNILTVPASALSGNRMNTPSSPPPSPDLRRRQRQSSGQFRTEAARRSLTGARLRKHADYQRAYTASRKRQSASMSWFLAPQQTLNDEQPAGPRVGLTAGKVLGKAHERNRIKRRMREALRRHVDLLPLGCDLILHPRRVILTIEFAKLEAEIVRILQQASAEAAKMTAFLPASSMPQPAEHAASAKPAL